jgi:hypothetical protein
VSHPLTGKNLFTWDICGVDTLIKSDFCKQYIHLINNFLQHLRYQKTACENIVISLLDFTQELQQSFFYLKGLQ